MREHEKSQSAILGLVIIFVIIFFAFFFFLSHGSHKSPTVPLSAVDKADNFLSVLLSLYSTMPQCSSDVSLSQMIEDCMNTNTHQTCDNLNNNFYGETFCYFAKNFTSYELNQTFKNEGYHYNLNLTLNSNNRVVLNLTYGQCKDNFVNSNIFSIPLRSGDTISAVLRLCK